MFKNKRIIAGILGLIAMTGIGIHANKEKFDEIKSKLSEVNSIEATIEVNKFNNALGKNEKAAEYILKFLSPHFVRTKQVYPDVTIEDSFNGEIYKALFTSPRENKLIIADYKKIMEELKNNKYYSLDNFSKTAAFDELRLKMPDITDYSSLEYMSVVTDDISGEKCHLIQQENRNDRNILTSINRYWIGVNDGIVRKIENKDNSGKILYTQTVKIRQINKEIEKSEFDLQGQSNIQENEQTDVLESGTIGIRTRDGEIVDDRRSANIAKIDLTDRIISEAKKNPNKDMFKQSLSTAINQLINIAATHSHMQGNIDNLSSQIRDQRDKGPEELEKYKKELKIREDAVTYYYVYTPENYDKEKKYKFLIFFHGRGVHPSVYFKEWIKELKDKDYIFIALKSIRQSQGWGQNDSGIIPKMMTTLMKEYKMNLKDTYYIGHSAGAVFAYVYAFTGFTPKGVISYAGQMVEPLREMLSGNKDGIVDKKKNLAFYQIVGEKDSQFKSATKKDKELFDKIGIKSTYDELSGKGHAFEFGKIPDILKWIEEQK